LTSRQLAESLPFRCRLSSLLSFLPALPALQLTGSSIKLNVALDALPELQCDPFEANAFRALNHRPMLRITFGCHLIYGSARTINPTAP
jgi:hypothetical protein